MDRNEFLLRQIPARLADAPDVNLLPLLIDTTGTDRDHPIPSFALSLIVAVTRPAADGWTAPDRGAPAMAARGTIDE